MPVLIAAQKADVDIVRAVALRLREAGGEVRCYLDDDDHELRDMGCKVAVGLLDDAYNLSGALTNVHTFMPLLPDHLTWRDPAEVAGITRAWADAAAQNEIEQTILAITALAPSSVTIQEVFEEVCDPLAIIRTGLLVGEERPLRSGDGAAALAAHVDRLADILASADDREELRGQWALCGWSTPLQSMPPQWSEEGVALDNSAAEEFSQIFPQFQNRQ